LQGERKLTCPIKRDGHLFQQTWYNGGDVIRFHKLANDRADFLFVGKVQIQYGNHFFQVLWDMQRGRNDDDRRVYPVAGVDLPRNLF